jgi:hypothetical protein
MERLTMTRISRRLRLLALIVGAGLATNPMLRAATITDPANDLRPADPTNSLAYAGPQTGPVAAALDVLSISVTLDPTQSFFTISQTMAGPIAGLIGTGNYSWGINHGFGTNSFPEIGLPNVKFDGVMSITISGTATNPIGTASFRGNTAPVTVNGNTLTADLSVAFLSNPTIASLPPSGWSFNLWPRATLTATGAAIPFGDAQIADFAPDTNDIFVTAPEPASIVAMGTGLVAVLWLSARRRRSRTSS